MAKNLVIVESPAKAKTLGKYLGKNYLVKASVGHVMDLPKSKLGVDVEKDFKPEYQVIHGKTKVLDGRGAARGRRAAALRRAAGRGRGPEARPQAAPARHQGARRSDPRRPPRRDLDGHEGRAQGAAPPSDAALHHVAPPAGGLPE